MAPISPGRQTGPPRKARKQTQTTKSHRYEPFTKRVSKLKIDPVHKVQQSRLKESSNDISQSYFRTALDEWSELNLTTTFTSFLNKVNPLSESLPQLLHHSDQVVGLLLEHIEKQDALALEALLSLVAHLAHDLGQEFEKYFARTVTLVAKVSGTQDDPAVVEACFTALAWMYKYLSRLLVHNLIPLLDIVWPYFSARKDYIRRFTAESLAFLIRKAAASYYKSQKPLRTALKHILELANPAQDKKNAAAATESVMILLSESAVGMDAGLHSSASNLFDCLYSLVAQDPGSSGASGSRIIEGFTINLIHQTDAIGFAPILDKIVEAARSQPRDSDEAQIVTKLLLVAAATRTGSRISDWTALIDIVEAKLAVSDLKSLSEAATTYAIKTAAVSIQYAPLDQLLPSVTKLINNISHNLAPRQFFTFCDLVARLGKTRFQDLLLPHLQQYIATCWGSDTSALTVALNDLHKLECTQRYVGKPGYISISDNWEVAICERQEQDIVQPVAGHDLYHDLLLTRSIHSPKSAQASRQLKELLQNLFERACSDKNQPVNMETRVALGWGLQTLLSLQGPKSPFCDELETILNQPGDRFHLLPFVEACTQLLFSTPAEALRNLQQHKVLQWLTENMLNPSRDLRKASVGLLKCILVGNELDWAHDCTSLVLEILETDYTIANARQLSMLIRRLPQMQKKVTGDAGFSKFLALFTIGLLPDYHDQLRRDAIAALSQMMTDTKIEDLVLDIIRDWLQAQSAALATTAVKAEDAVSDRVSQFECTRFNAVEDEFDVSLALLSEPEQTIRFEVESAHVLLPVRTPSDSRMIALQVLVEIASTAERRSKIVVPAFLAAQKGRAGHDLTNADEAQSINTLSPEIEERGWSLKERKLFLQLIGKFNNPKMLYRSDDVYAILLELLANGDAETRRLAFQAVLKWKNKNLTSHQEALLRVAEDKITTSELGLMLSSDEDSSTIKDGGRAEVLPALLRLVFGQLIGRVGVHGSQEAKRKSLLRLLFRMREPEILSFLDVVLGRLREVYMVGSQGTAKNLLVQDLINQDQQYGFLRMVLSMLEILQTRFSTFGHKIVDAVLYCTTRASHQINMMDDTEAAPVMLRNIRRAGIQCLTLIGQHCPQLSLDPYISIIFSELINPKISKFVIENSQSISGLLRMFSAWSESESKIAILEHNNSCALQACWDLLAAEFTKPEVKAFVLQNIVSPMLDQVDKGATHAMRVIGRQSSPMINSINQILQNAPSKEILLVTTKVVQRLATHVDDENAKSKITGLLITILNEPNQRLPPHIKAQVLQAIEGVAGSSIVFSDPEISERFFSLLSGYFDFFRDTTNRETCSRLLKILAQHRHGLEGVASTLDDLNAYSATSLDAVDHDRQSTAFSSIHNLLQDGSLPLSTSPIMHNLIFMIRTSEDTATRGNALGCLKHFTKCLVDGTSDAQALRNILLRAIRKHIKDNSESVRADFVELLGGAVKSWTDEMHLQDMRVLLVGDDEEASFFANILHIQQHRRNRAMRRLTTEVESGAISAASIADYFLPLLQKYAEDDSTTESALAIKGQSIASLTVLLQWLDWKTFRRMFRHYRQILDQKNDDNKIDIRLLNHATDALSAAVSLSESGQHNGIMPHLARSLPAVEIVTQELKSSFIPKLSELSHYKDEGEITERIPAAVVAVKLIKLLPEYEVSLLASPVVLDIAQILRSRTQETRDLARNKLAEVVELLGPTSMKFVLKELRTALTKGYQLHVLSYTLHTMLLTTSEQRSIGDLDYCVEDLVKVILDDTFGVVGQEKDNQDYISSMKEVKSNKSFDSMEILAKCTSVKHLSKLVLPFEPLLTGSLSTKQSRHVDELFRRIGVGISHSPAASSQDLLILAFELIQSFYRAKPAPPLRQRTNDEKNRDRYLVQLDSKSRAGVVSSSSLLFKLAKFAIDIARSSFARHIELMTPDNVDGFIPIIGDALVEAQEDVKISALRLLSTVIKLRMPKLSENAQLYVMEAVKVVKSAISTNEEAAQAALKLVAAIIREKHDVEVRESDIAYLLKRTMPDLEEPDRQGITFNFVKAVMARQMQMPEVYELVDKIGLMMVTSQSRSSREAARGVYAHFLLDYPQGKTRWAKQVKFLVKNLEYQYPEGRQSVMEVIRTLIVKMDLDTAQELAAVAFVPLILRMANDDNQLCRELAGVLLSQLFSKASSNNASTMLEPMRAWLEQHDNVTLRKASLQAWTMYFTSMQHGAKPEVPTLQKQILAILRNDDDDDSNWEVKYHALELCAVMVKNHPQAMLTNKQHDLWTHVVSALGSIHSWLQNSASNLIGLYFRECIASNSVTVPLTCSQGLKLDELMLIDIFRSSIRILKRQSTTTELAELVIQNALFLGRCVDAAGTRIPIKDHKDDASEDDQDVNKSNINEEEQNDTDSQTNVTAPSILALQYLLDQSTHVIRREPPKQTSAALTPKLSMITTLTHLLPHLSATTLTPLTPSLTSLLIPLLHLTSPSTPTPRSADQSFNQTYTLLIERAQLLLENLQAALGDKAYMQFVTAATRIARERRDGRRNKRAIEVVAEPERAARGKVRKVERKKERRREVKGIHRGARRRDLGF